jgi:hypothetical protein
MARHVRSWIVVLTASAVVSVSGQVRDGGAQPTAGSSAIVGQVLTNDPQPRPVRGAIVTVSGDVAGSRSVVTDDQGRFEVGGLAAGRFVVAAAKAAFLPAAFGAVRPGRAGSAVVLEPGQRFTAVLRMMRGSVLSGVVRDEHGLPAAGVEVVAINARGAQPGLPAQSRPVGTDDRGAFRLFGLMPGDYYLSATPRLRSAGQIQQRTTAEIDAALAGLRQRQGSTTAPPPRGGPSSVAAEPMSVTYAATFLPGVSQMRHATRIRVGVEEERTGLDFALAPVRVAAIEGAISGDITSLAAVQLSIMLINEQGDPSGMVSTSGSPVLTVPPDGSGRFQYTNVRPGTYRIVARTARGSANESAKPEPASVMTVGGGGGGGGFKPAEPAGPAGAYYYAIADVDVDGQDVRGVALALQPGSSFSGRIRFDGATHAPPADLTTWQVRLASPGGSYMATTGRTLLGTSLNSTPPVPVGADGRFEFNNIAPGRYLLDVTGPERKDGWWVRSAIVDGRDLLDVPPQFAPGLDVRGVAVTLSDRHTELAGTLQTPVGVPAPDYFVLAFPADSALWRAGSRRVQTARPATDGAFVLRGLPPGDYLVAALTDVTPGDLNDAAFLRQASQASVAVALGEGERTVQHLRLAGGR